MIPASGEFRDLESFRRTQAFVQPRTSYVPSPSQVRTSTIRETGPFLKVDARVRAVLAKHVHSSAIIMTVE